MLCDFNYYSSQPWWSSTWSTAGKDSRSHKLTPLETQGQQLQALSACCFSQQPLAAMCRAVDSNITHFSQVATSSAFSHNSCLPLMEKGEESGENPSTFCCQRAPGSTVLCSEARAYCCPIVGSFNSLLHPILTQYCKDFCVLNCSVLCH